jgi:hypothetical protein
LIQKIISDHINEFYDIGLPPNKLKAMFSIINCRTKVLGSHVDICSNCGKSKISYNSCRNRHCPTCQNFSKEEWIEGRNQELINTHYFHLVFTIPSELNELIYNNQKQLYSLLFKCSYETIKELAADPKYLGAEIGATSVLHTWSQTLIYHPHVHMIVPGGGLTKCGLEFKKSSSKFFIPVRVMSKKFRGKFISLLKLKIKENKVHLPKNTDLLKLKNLLYSKKWVVFCKEPFKKAEYVIKYLGRYTHKIAITNSRIIKYKNNKVTFKYKDNKSKNKPTKLMVLSANEFIRRFLLHVLPEKFIKIRHYGILGNRNKKTKLKKCQILTETKLFPKLDKREILKRIFGYDVLSCPFCGFKLVSRYFIEPKFGAA